ncbi:choice-of-anchor J domain-containing protein [Flavobacterium lindanitolerans]|nr:choice-of-anchor J domain-containing protein [Flavobacterium lindanitolerans]
MANLASSWEYVVQPADAGAPTGSGTATNTNVGNLINTGLAAGQSYDLYVRSVCGGVPGNWSLPYRFATQCIFNTPYSDSFDGITSNPVPCWIPIDINNDGNKWGAGYENLGIRIWNAQTANDDMIVSPIINLGTTPKRLKFKYSTSGGSVRFSVVLSTTGITAADFTTILLPSELIDTNDEGLEKIINIPTSITGNVNFAFYIHPEAGETAFLFNIDNVIVEDKPECSDPLALTANNITTSTADLSGQQVISNRNGRL